MFSTCMYCTCTVQVHLKATNIYYYYYCQHARLMSRGVSRKKQSAQYDRFERNEVNDLRDVNEDFT